VKLFTAKGNYESTQLWTWAHQMHDDGIADLYLLTMTKQSIRVPQPYRCDNNIPFARSLALIQACDAQWPRICRSALWCACASCGSAESEQHGTALESDRSRLKRKAWPLCMRQLRRMALSLAKS
jgi:hypothetical protein